MVAHDKPYPQIDTFGRALEGLPWPALLVAADGQLHAANPAAHRLLHTPTPGRLDSRLDAYFDPASACLLNAALRGSGPRTLALTLRPTASADERLVHGVVAPQTDGDWPALSVVALLEPALPSALSAALGAAVARGFEAPTLEALHATLGDAVAPFGLHVEIAGDGAPIHPCDVPGEPCAAPANLPGPYEPLSALLTEPYPPAHHGEQPLTIPLKAQPERQTVLRVSGPGLDAGVADQITAFAPVLALAVKQLDQAAAPPPERSETELLLQASQAISAVTELDQVLRVICQQALTISGGVTASLLKPEPDGVSMRCVMAVGAASDLLLGQRSALTATAVGRAFLERRDVIVDDVAELPGATALGAPPTALRSGVFVVMQTHGRVGGLLAVGHPTPRFFGTRAASTLAQYAASAAIALENAELHEAMRRSEERYRTLFQNALEVVVTLDLEGRILSWNRAALQFLGVSPAELRGGIVNIRDLVVPEKVALIAELQARALEGHAVAPTEIELRRPGGPPAVLELTVQLLQERDQQPSLYIIGRDMTERRQLEAQLRQGEKLAALGQLVAGAAHELNNPLAVVLGTTQLLLRDPLAQSFGDDVRSIEAAAQRARHIVKQLLTFARQHEETRCPVELRPLVERVLAGLQPRLDEHQVSVALDLAPQLPPVWGDSYQLEQVLDNLLHNAVHALAERAAPRRIAIGATVAGSLLRLQVTDNGPGMAPAVLSRIFDPFFTTKQVGSGTGLGLSLVHGIVSKHGGSIRAESEPGQGATFVVELPVSAAPVVQPEPAAATVPNDKLILIVEDELDVRMILERALTQYGYTVDAVESAEAALGLLDARRYDLVITDMRMPGMSGRALFERVRVAQPELSWVFVTGDTMSVTSETFLKQTGVPFLPKPFSLDELWEAVALATQPNRPQS